MDQILIYDAVWNMESWNSTSYAISPGTSFEAIISGVQVDLEKLGQDGVCWCPGSMCGQVQHHIHGIGYLHNVAFPEDVF